MPPSRSPESSQRVVEDVACLGCGCACDDIRIVVRGTRIVEAVRACALGRAWFGDGVWPAETAIDARPATLREAVDAAADLIAAARRPLVYLAPGLTNEAIREAVALADVLGAALDSVTSETAMGSILAAQERGRASATLGEARQRADVIVWWGVDPSKRYPRYEERYAPMPPEPQAPGAGGSSRTVIAVDVGGEAGPGDVDRRFILPREDEVATLGALRALVTAGSGGVPLHGADPVAAAIWARARALAPGLVAGRYVLVVADAESPAGVPASAEHVRLSALIALVQAMNGPTRAALSLLRAGGNRSGADAVLTSQTGYPAAVDFSRGAPRYRPFDGTASLLAARRELDAVLVAGRVDDVPETVSALLAAIPSVLIGPGASAARVSTHSVAVDTGLAGVHDAGTVLRLDDVPLPVRAVIPGPRAAAAVVKAVLDAVVTLRQTQGNSQRRMV